MNQKLYRTIVSILVIVLIFTSMPLVKNYMLTGKQRTSNHGNLVVNTKVNGNVEVTNKIKDTTLKVKYTKDTDKYTLSKDDVEYSLATKKYENDILLVDLESSSVDYDGVVVGQFPLAIPLILWTPALIEAAQITIAAAVAVVGTYTVWYTVDSIAQTIETTKEEAKPIAQEIAKEDSKKSTGYYAAALVGGKVAISRELTYAEAVARLVAGMDVFATTKMAASSVAFAATAPSAKMVFHLSHESGEGFYPHFHPGGRKWIVNPKNAPHCWFGPTPGM